MTKAAMNVTMHHLLPRLVGAVLMLIGIFLCALGTEMLPLPLSWLILASGVLSLLSGYLVYRRRRVGTWVYLITAVFTFLWAMSTSPLYPTKLVNNLWFIPVLGILVSLTHPVRLPQNNVQGHVKGAAAAIAVLAIGMCVSAFA